MYLFIRAGGYRDIHIYVTSEWVHKKNIGNLNFYLGDTKMTFVAYVDSGFIRKKIPRRRGFHRESEIIYVMNMYIPATYAGSTKFHSQYLVI